MSLLDKKPMYLGFIAPINVPEPSNPGMININADTGKIRSGSEILPESRARLTPSQQRAIQKVAPSNTIGIKLPDHPGGAAVLYTPPGQKPKPPVHKAVPNPTPVPPRHTPPKPIKSPPPHPPGHKKTSIIDLSNLKTAQANKPNKTTTISKPEPEKTAIKKASNKSIANSSFTSSSGSDSQQTQKSSPSDNSGKYSFSIGGYTYAISKPVVWVGGGILGAAFIYLLAPKYPRHLRSRK